MKAVSENKMYGGLQRVYEHKSASCACDMRFGVFLPPAAIADPATKLPALFWLSGLTCTEQNFVTKAGAQRLAAELGMIIIAPDTSPRGDAVPDDKDNYDFGQGAGFYVDATRMPWAKHYNMYSYVTEELYDLVIAELPVDVDRIGISGHSMGGHGALTIHLKNPQKFKSVSAFSPIVAPTQVPWGKKALAGYLGDDTVSWQDYDAAELVRRQKSTATLLVEQGAADEFLAEQLQPELLQAACEQAGQNLVLNMRDGYDHSYYFIGSFIEDHLRHHHAVLCG